MLRFLQSGPFADPTCPSDVEPWSPRYRHWLESLREGRSLRHAASGARSYDAPTLPELAGAERQARFELASTARLEANVARAGFTPLELDHDAGEAMPAQLAAWALDGGELELQLLRCERCGKILAVIGGSGPLSRLMHSCT